ncbi:MAG: carboxypeptidase-like regulatory domain-containing protein [Gemmatimonadales bacterium]|nr:carboxypeptidase-like regulatory domain-containing protein [Gemmatimonadales bacterium]
MKVGRFLRRSLDRLNLALVAAATLGTAACSGLGESFSEGPAIPEEQTPVNPQLKAAAFIFDVDARTGKVKVTAPTRTVNNLGPSFSPDLRPEFSLLGGDVIDVTASAFAASPVGAACAGGQPGQPNKVCVTFDVSLTNKLGSVQLVGPTVFPIPPAGTTGPLLFPFDLTVTTTSGGVSTGGQGNDVLVELPSYGLVESNPVWDGSPHNFFNDTGCPAGSNDCFRWEEYTGPIVAGATTVSQKVGFYIDPTVGNFRARLLVAADLQNSGAAPTGTVAGSVTSPQIGALSNVTVTVTSGGFTGTTGAGGAYSIANVTTGPKTVTLSNLPASCTAPAAQTTTVNAGATSTVNFTVNCVAPSGTVSGTVTSSLGGGIQNATVTVTPGGTATTNASGAYSVGAPVGSGTVAVTNLPANCSAVASQPYTIATNGQVVNVNFVATCTAPPPNTLTGTWTVSGSVATLELRANITSGNVGSLQFDFNANSSRLTYTGNSAPAAPAFPNAFATSPPATIVTVGALTTAASGATGNTGVIVLTFNIGAGAAATVNSLVSNFQAVNAAFGDVTSTFAISIAPLTLP